ncbi:MAG TPA: metal ABC transporter ATP-binding protein [Acidimicrobiales bacterium]|nr:metal ABC transporter ATP-binding protein [Acidimicrobiales bacterium]
MSPPGAPPLVRLEGVTCRFGAAAVLDQVDLTVAEGSFIGVVGPSGSGKTTLLRVVTGTVRPAAGRVQRRPGVRVAYVPQVETVNWNFPVTVGECVLMARTRGRRLPWPSAAEKAEVAEVLEVLGIGELGRRHIRDLSGGQQQRVFVARALLGRPELLLLDEPTSGVDVRTRHEVLHLLTDLNRAGLSIVLTTHDLNGMAAHLPALVCLNRRVIGTGPPRSVLTADVLERTYGARMEVLDLGGMPVVVDGHAGPGPAADPATGTPAGDLSRLRPPQRSVR